MLHTTNSRVLISNSQSRVGAHNAIELEGVGWVKFLSCGYAQRLSRVLTELVLPLLPDHLADTHTSYKLCTVRTKLCKSWASQASINIKGTMSVFSRSTAYLKLLCCITQLIGSKYSSQRKWSHLQGNTT